MCKSTMKRYVMKKIMIICLIVLCCQKLIYAPRLGAGHLSQREAFASRILINFFGDVWVFRTIFSITELLMVNCNLKFAHKQYNIIYRTFVWAGCVVMGLFCGDILVKKCVRAICQVGPFESNRLLFQEVKLFTLPSISVYPRGQYVCHE